MIPEPNKIHTNYYRKLICERTLILSEELIPIIPGATEPEILAIIDINGELTQNVLILKEAFMFLDIITDFAAFKTALSEGRIEEVKEDLRGQIVKIADICEENAPNINNMGFDSAMQAIAQLRVLKHLHLVSPPLTFERLMDQMLGGVVDIAFFEGSTGQIHIPRFCYNLLAKISPLRPQGGSVSNNCVILDIQEVVYWAKPNASILVASNRLSDVDMAQQ